jgi:hypothetical protein
MVALAATLISLQREFNLRLPKTVSAGPSPISAETAIAATAREPRKLPANGEFKIRLSPAAWQTPVLRIALLTLVAVAVHGYHLGVDDSGIYLPAVLRVIHPDLYPYGAEFFLAHARLSLFAAIVGASSRLARLPFARISDDLVIFLWHLATLFLFLLASWQLARALFATNRARWSALLVSAATLTVPVAGTALVIMDPYLTARSASTPFTVFAAAAWLQGRRSLALIWIVLAFLVHPLMAADALLCLGFLGVPAAPIDRLTERLFGGSSKNRTAHAFAVAPFPFTGGLVGPAYRQAISMRRFLFLSRWAWWEWMGLAAPIAILGWLGRLDPRGVTPVFSRTCRALALLGIFATISGLLVSVGPAMDGFVWLQPLRAFQLIYIFLFVLLGGLLGEYALQSRRWLWIAFFAVLACGMYSIQRSAFPDSRHIEWPWAAPGNAWVAAFQWVRDNTPQNAVFALDPEYIELPGEDQHGFRAIARRSMLSDYYKDSGVVSVFPRLADEWQREQRAQQGWKSFNLADFQRLAREYPVTWVVLQGNVPPGLDCFYRNRAVAVCRIPGADGL